MNQKTQILIEIDNETGAVNLTGPLDNTIFMLGVLETAKNVALNYGQKLAREKNMKNVVVPKMLMSKVPKM